MNHCDVIPQLQMRHNGQQRFRIIRAEKLQCPVGENDAESEGRISRVLFENRDLDFGAAFFYTVGAVKAGRSGSGDYDPHAQLTLGCCRSSDSFADMICRRDFLSTLPTLVRGNASTISMRSGYMNFAIWRLEGNATISGRSSGAPSLVMMNAHGRSPNSRSGIARSRTRHRRSHVELKKHA